MLNLDESLRSELPQARYLVLELAALLDRLAEAAQRDKRTLVGDVRLRHLHSALDVLSSPGGTSSHAEQILRLYSETEPLVPEPGR